MKKNNKNNHTSKRQTKKVVETQQQPPVQVIANNPEVVFNPRLDALKQMRSALTEFYGRTLKDPSAVEEKVQRQLLHHFPQLSRSAVRP